MFTVVKLSWTTTKHPIAKYQLYSSLQASLLRNLLITRSNELNILSGDTNDDAAECRITTKSIKPAGSSQLTPTEDHHVTGFILRTAGVKKRFGYGWACAWKDMAAARNSVSRPGCFSMLWFHTLTIEHVGYHMAGLDSLVKPLPDSITMWCQYWFSQQLLHDVVGISKVGRFGLCSAATSAAALQLNQVLIEHMVHDLLHDLTVNFMWIVLDDTNQCMSNGSSIECQQKDEDEWNPDNQTTGLMVCGRSRSTC